MAKSPSFQFYPGDWFREPGLKRVGLNVRGAWAELLMIMWDETPQGRIQTHIGGYAQTWRIDLKEACFIIDELEKNNIADVEYYDSECQKIVQKCADAYIGLSPGCPDVSPNCPVYVTITNRRMYNQWKAKEYERLKKKEQRKKSKRPGDVPQKSRSLSSSSTSASVIKGVTSVTPFVETDVPTEGGSKPPLCPHQKIIDLYHEILPEHPNIVEWDDTARSWLRSRWRSKPKYQSLDFWKSYFEFIRKSKFLLEGKDTWMPDLRWFVRPQNFAKVLNGNYHNQQTFNAAMRWLNERESKRTGDR